VHVVPDAAATQVRRRAAVVLASLVAAAVPFGCGGSGDTRPNGARGFALNADLRMANCKDWKKGTIRERYGTLDDLKSFAGGPVGNASGGNGAVLSPTKAYNVLTNWCLHTFARDFKLYKLYTRAAAFTPQR
jgi:hypothetical protein